MKNDLESAQSPGIGDSSGRKKRRSRWKSILAFAVPFSSAGAETRGPGLHIRGTPRLHDPWPLVQRYYEALEASRGEELVWFEHSAHVPGAEEPEKFEQEMLRVLSETHSREGPSR